MEPQEVENQSIAHQSKPLHHNLQIPSVVESTQLQSLVILTPHGYHLFLVQLMVVEFAMAIMLHLIALELVGESNQKMSIKAVALLLPETVKACVMGPTNLM